MLAKKFRLVKKASFAYVYRKGSPNHTNCLSIIVLKSVGTGIKIGFSVSNKVGKACKRNLVKRRLRAIVASFLLSMTVGVQVVVIAKPEIVAVGYKEMKRMLEHLLTKSKLIGNK